MNIFRSFSTALFLLSSSVCTSAANRLTLPSGEWIEYDRVLVAELADPLYLWKMFPSHRTGWDARDHRFRATWTPPPSSLRQKFEALSEVEKKLITNPPRPASRETYWSTTDRVVVWRCSAGFTQSESEKYHFAWVDRDGWEGDLDLNTVPAINHERRISPGVMPRRSPTVTLRAWLASDFNTKRASSKPVAELTMVNPCFIASPLWPESKQVSVLKVRDTEIKLERLIRNRNNTSFGGGSQGIEFSISAKGALAVNDFSFLKYSFADNLGNYIAPGNWGRHPWDSRNAKSLFNYTTSTRALWHDATSWQLRLYICPEDFSKLRKEEVHTFTHLELPKMGQSQTYTGQVETINSAIVSPTAIKRANGLEIGYIGSGAEVRFVELLFELKDMKPNIVMARAIHWKDDQGRKDSELQFQAKRTEETQYFDREFPIVGRAFGVFADAKWLDVTVAVPTIEMLDFYASPEFIE